MKRTPMQTTRKQAITNLWVDKIDLIDYTVGDNKGGTSINVDDFETLFALCYTADKRNRAYAVRMTQLLPLLKTAHAQGQVLDDELGAAMALIERIELEIVAFTKPA